ncbi:hypothetical protein FPZ11_14825 [Humibacter ginsenosidimutans]|uniref:Alpha-N-acetylglucosaminidase n=1 Tax=Humibacter ginsenosidimutans TaxID=2599293 RepID=A0A5B8M872_9MICO|nr:hypothetical protein FPZ11_14825 [Humibacter ginsenosidimutans]
MPATKQYRSRRRTWLSGLALIVPALLVVGLVPTGAALADDGDAIAQWDFTTGSATDVSWNGSDGTAGSGVSFDTTNGATFDGTDNGEITVGYNSLHDYRPDAAGADGTWRMELDGVTPSAVGPDYRTIVGSRSNDNGWAVYVTNQKKLEFWMAQNSGSTTYATAKSGVTAAVGGTYDIVVEKTGSQISISVTGSASGSGTATLGGGYKAVGTDAPLRFGNGGNAGNQYFFKGSVKSATVNVDESDGGQPPTTPPVTVPKPVYPLPDSTYEQAAHDVLARAIGTAADQVAFTLARSTDGIEKYTIGGTSGHIDITATTPSALTAGAGWYLKYVVHAAVNLGQPNPVVPATLPAPAQAITNTAHEGYRYALNDTNEGYTDPYLDWNGWQQFLDNLALHGINQVFVSVGTDAVYEKLLQKYGYSADEARAWIPQPAHQPWWVLQNISSDGQDAMTQTLLDERAQLAHQIVDYANDLGITPCDPRLLRNGSDGLRAAQSGCERRGSGHVERIRTAELARPDQHAVRQGGRRLLQHLQSIDRRRRRLQDGSAARGRQVGQHLRLGCGHRHREGIAPGSPERDLGSVGMAERPLDDPSFRDQGQEPDPDRRRSGRYADHSG